MTKNLRNVLIVFALAAIVVAVPGGHTGASVITQTLSLIFLASLAWFGSVLYRQHRYELMGLGERRRVTLYVAAGVLAITLTATHRLWASSAGSVAWLVLIAGSLYGIVSVFIASRRY